MANINYPVGNNDDVEQNKIDILNKVDKVTGKGLSTEDYTTEEKAKMANVPENTTASLAENMQYQNELSQQSNGVKFVAHRGASQVFPENSIPAYQSAGKSGFWGAECDISPTSDGVWVLMHDDTIDRTTNGTGNVNALTLAQIKAFNIDIGANIGLYPNLKVPTLEEYLITCKNYNLVPYIEIKGITSATNYDSLIELIRKYGFEAKCIIISGYIESLQEIRLRTKLVHLQYVVNAIYATTFPDAIALGNSSLGLEYTIATQLLIGQVHDNGLKVGVWTVNDYSTAKTMIEYGVDFITSDLISNVRWEL